LVVIGVLSLVYYGWPLIPIIIACAVVGAFLSDVWAAAREINGPLTPALTEGTTKMLMLQIAGGILIALAVIVIPIQIGEALDSFSRQRALERESRQRAKEYAAELLLPLEELERRLKEEKDAHHLFYKPDRVERLETMIYARKDFRKNPADTVYKYEFNIMREAKRKATQKAKREALFQRMVAALHT
jgi:hypothetical protein